MSTQTDTVSGLLFRAIFLRYIPPIAQFSAT
jgi:hypothetical protein